MTGDVRTADADGVCSRSQMRRTHPQAFRISHVRERTWTQPYV